jgi:hypothetical protein
MIVYLYHVDFWIGKTINMQPKSNKFQDQINMYIYTVSIHNFYIKIKQLYPKYQ